MPEYEYELRRGDSVVATGRLSRDDPLEVGDRVMIGARPGVVRAVYPRLGERTMRVVVQLMRHEDASE